MRLISNKALKTFARVRRGAETPLRAWRKRIEHGAYRSFAELQQGFNGVDKVDDLYVFNVGGNKYRVICAIHFNRQMVFVRDVLTHAEYDLSRWRKQ